MSNDRYRVPAGSNIFEHRNWTTFRSLEKAEHWLSKRFDNKFEIVFCPRCNHWHAVKKAKKPVLLKKPICRKIKHETEQAAKIHADGINMQEHAKNVIPYLCHICGYWHVGNIKR